MSSESILHIKASKGVLTFAAKNGGKVSIKDLQLKALWGYCWLHGLPYIETFLAVMELLLKKIVSDVIDHEDLNIEYRVIANDTPEEANQIEVIFNNIRADDVEFHVLGDIIFQGEDNRGFIRKITSFRRSVDENIQNVL
ncbi:MAG TPA: hypothetical protein HA298_03440 [Methanobacteriales archaeon]|nr:hypothetical protein [Methanobacteriaceae archaeon]MBC7097351.1 hypothetical protein [Methanobacteriales archaeon]HIH61728.1 hypothetical protein [Methanobacteriales archaeon]